MDFNNKIALVTGGSRGLGKNMALRLAKYGADVVITYHSKKEEANTVASEIERNGQKAVALHLDVADIKSFDGFMQQVSEGLNACALRRPGKAMPFDGNPLRALNSSGRLIPLLWP